VDHTPLGNKIRKRRIELELSREQLADRMRELGQTIRGQQIYRWEQKGAVPRGRATSVLERALDVPPGWLHNEVTDEAGEISYSGLITVLDERQATPDERERLGAHLRSLEAQSDIVTPQYVKGYIDGMRNSDGAKEAHSKAVNEQVHEQMKSEGRRIVKKKGKR
jgi:transcriptional regulator with XRE-family HTH domain